MGVKEVLIRATSKRATATCSEEVGLDDGQVCESVGRGRASFADGFDGLCRIGFGGFGSHGGLWPMVCLCDKLGLNHSRNENESKDVKRKTRNV